MSTGSKRRRLPLKFVVALAVLVLLVEAGAYVFMVVLGKNFYLPLALDNISQETITDDIRSRFSAEFGWTPALSRSEIEAEPVDGAALAVFGDEYSLGRGHEGDPWPALLEDKLGQPVLNFAGGAWGPGQAYLRFERDFTDQLATPYVALVMMSGGSARMVNRYRGFYARGANLHYPKPMFQKNDDGGIEVLPNPVASADDLVKLGDPAFLETIGEGDYWYDYYGAYGLNEQVGFPYSLRLAKAVPYYVKRWRDHSLANRQSYQDVYRDEDATDVLRHIVQTFIDKAEGQGSVPIFVIIPNRPDMANHLDHGETAYAAFFEELRSIGHPHIHDGLGFFQGELDQGAGLDAFYRARNDDRLTPEAERVIADGMQRLLEEIDAGEQRLSPSITTSKVTD